MRALEQSDPDFILQATRYSLIEHVDALTQLFPKCREKGAQVIVGAPLNAGFLAGVDRYNYGSEIPEPYLKKREALRAVAKKHRVDLRTAALQFTAAPDVVAATIPGARNVAQARQNHASMAVELPQAFWEELRAAGLIAEEAPVPGAGALG